MNHSSPFVAEVIKRRYQHLGLRRGGETFDTAKLDEVKFRVGKFGCTKCDEDAAEIDSRRDGL